jgi:hypothetical protein
MGQGPGRVGIGDRTTSLIFILLVQGRHRSDKIINNRPCQILRGKR